eukprot:5713066-Pyramimonas_sp.AAC.1
MEKRGEAVRDSRLVQRAFGTLHDTSRDLTDLQPDHDVSMRKHEHMLSAHEHDMHAQCRMFQRTRGSDLAMVAKTEMKNRPDAMPCARAVSSCAKE